MITPVCSFGVYCSIFAFVLHVDMYDMIFENDT